MCMYVCIYIHTHIYIYICIICINTYVIFKQVLAEDGDGVNVLGLAADARAVEGRRQPRRGGVI